MAGAAKKFNLTELLNQRSKEAGEQQKTEQQQAAAGAEVVTSEEGVSSTADIYDLIPSKGNFYSVEDVQDLKQSIELLGVLQPLLVTDEEEDGKRRIIAGHRRRLAVMQLVDEGKERFRRVPILIKPKKNAILDRLALIMANRFREKTDWERMTEALETEKLVLELKESMNIPGRTRDLLAEIIETSPAQVGRYKAIYNNIIPELMAEFKANRIVVSVIYEASGLPEDYQKQAAEVFRENEVLTLSDIKQLKKNWEASQQIPGQMDISQMEEKQEAAGARESTTGNETDQQQEEADTEGAGEATEGTEDATGQQSEYVDPQPEQITSLCYSCTHYEDCHDKTATVTSCNAYENRRETQKTDEERYNEEQAAIDRETQKKLREMQQEEKMQHLPSDDRKEKTIRVSPEKMKAVAVDRTRPYMILKNDDYREGDTVKLIEFAEGRATGNTADMKIICMDDDTTSSALEDGYCVIALK
ncbi:MAG: ParB N-terminal domain-containing protein [Phascolarctobacterium faecium]|uniref:ParB/RepB/Spo0J family partition protein n=1 Tax=Phascolarctobacterium faecium TaxID=33025 RepID=UPI002E76EFE6|nr:ParB N-terminal domain-containing protein [Phascolarctobacterium faecium]MED9991140.1 ParB N-terminal domain-containing protein [Phascolarctobacterium faecium]